MRSIEALFEHLGGTASVARILKKNASTASEMKRRRSIPTRYWPVLMAATRATGVDLDEAMLLQLHLAAQADEAAA